MSTKQKPQHSLPPLPVDEKGIKDYYTTKSPRNSEGKISKEKSSTDFEAFKSDGKKSDSKEKLGNSREREQKEEKDKEKDTPRRRSRALSLIGRKNSKGNKNVVDEEVTGSMIGGFDPFDSSPNLLDGKVLGTRGESWRGQNAKNKRSVLIMIDNRSTYSLIRKGQAKLYTGSWAKRPPAAISSMTRVQFGSYDSVMKGASGRCFFTVDVGGFTGEDAEKSDKDGKEIDLYWYHPKVGNSDFSLTLSDQLSKLLTVDRNSAKSDKSSTKAMIKVRFVIYDTDKPRPDRSLVKDVDESTGEPIENDDDIEVEPTADQSTLNTNSNPFGDAVSSSPTFNPFETPDSAAGSNWWDSKDDSDSSDSESKSKMPKFKIAAEGSTFEDKPKSAEVSPVKSIEPASSGMNAFGDDSFLKNLPQPATNSKRQSIMKRNNTGGSETDSKIKKNTNVSFSAEGLKNTHHSPVIERHNESATGQQDSKKAAASQTMNRCVEQLQMGNYAPAARLCKEAIQLLKEERELKIKIQAVEICVAYRLAINILMGTRTALSTDNLRWRLLSSLKLHGTHAAICKRIALRKCLEAKDYQNALDIILRLISLGAVDIPQLTEKLDLCRQKGASDGNIKDSLICCQTFEAIDLSKPNSVLRCSCCTLGIYKVQGLGVRKGDACDLCEIGTLG
eukprot:TRINITY_DN5895_c0_g1_i1.p1 TRINITY_DN5895_c0_g1~~TRINITY_DN5895_c0_g1_i1.p1  ORF type:complete len:673 (+),score=135.15 TRINITY_DN5895_c0_g1_i1:66-2084(+)